MTTLTVFRRTIADQRVPALAWSVALMILAFVHVVLFPQYRDASSALSQMDYYKALAGEAGGIGTPGGYLNAEYFTGAPIMVLIFAIIAGTGVIASEETGGTLDLVLAQPVRRARFLLEKTAGLVVLVVIVAMASLPGLVAGSLVVDFDISSLRLAEACLNIVPIALLYLSLAILGSAAIPGRTASTIIAISAATAGYFLSIFGTFVEALDQVRKLSPFYWANYGSVIAHGTDWARDAAFVGVSAVLLTLATIVFVRRDVSANGRSWGWRLRRRPIGRQHSAAHPATALAPSSRWPMFVKTLRDQRTSTIAWSAGVFAMGLITVAIYPQFREAFKAFDAQGAFAPFAGKAGSLSSPAGYLSLEYFSYVPLLILIAVVIAGTGVVAGDEAGGTLELLLAQPIRRWRVIIEKSAALVADLLAITAASMAGLVVGALLVDLDLPMLRLAGAALFMAPLVLLYLSFAVLASAAIPNRTAGTIVVVAAAIAAYFVNTLGAFVDSLDVVRKVSPFYWADFSSALVEGFPWLTACLFTLVSLSLLVTSAMLFERRDLSAASPFLAVRVSWLRSRRSRPALTT